MFGSIASGLSSLGGYLGSAGSKVAGFLGDNAESLISGGASLLSGALSTPLQLYGSKKLMRYQRHQNEEYNKWLIPFQNEENLKFQDAYLRNSPAATVAGLRTAGLNPILAVNGGFHTGTPSSASGGSSGSGGSISSPNTRVDLMQLMNMQKQNDLLQAQIEGQKIKNNNDSKNMGLSGRDATYARIFNEVKELIGEENLGKLSKGTLDSIKSLFDSPEKYNSLFDYTPASRRPNSIPDNPIISEDTPPSMSVYTQSSPKPYFDQRKRPFIYENKMRHYFRQKQKEDRRKRLHDQLDLKDFYNRNPNIRKHLYR